eukprot:COSAG01_NODE_72186_length_253_cov_1.785714_1_plen_84_part_11
MDNFIIPALHHHCAELRQCVLTEVKEFGMPQHVIALRLAGQLLDETGKADRPWYAVISAVRSLGKLQLEEVGKDDVVQALVDVA